MVLEGPTLVSEALESDVAVEAVFVDVDADGADIAPVMALAAQSGVECHTVTSGVLGSISDVVSPRPVLAVAPIPAGELDAVVADCVDQHRHLLVLVDVRDPGNLGTIIRAADASGAAGVICSVGTVDPWSPKVVRSSAGSVLRVPILSGLPGPAVIDILQGAGVATIGTTLDAATGYDELRLDGAVALVLGNEAHGLDPAVAASLDRLVTIPMVGRAESLNVAMAAAILSFEVLRQHRHRPDPTAPGDSDWTSPPRGDKVIGR